MVPLGRLLADEVPTRSRTPHHHRQASGPTERAPIDQGRLGTAGSWGSWFLVELSATNGKVIIFPPQHQPPTASLTCLIPNHAIHAIPDTSRRRALFCVLSPSNRERGWKKKTIAHQILLFPFELQHPITRRNDPYNERLGKNATMY